MDANLDPASLGDSAAEQREYLAGEALPSLPTSPFQRTFSGACVAAGCDSICYSAIGTSGDRRSLMARLLGVQGLYRIHRCGAMCGNIAGS